MLNDKNIKRIAKAVGVCVGVVAVECANAYLRSKGKEIKGLNKIAYGIGSAILVSSISKQVGNVVEVALTEECGE